MLLEDVARIGTLVGVAVAAVGVAVAAFGILYNTWRAKRELAVNLVNSWARDFDIQMKHAVELGRTLDQELVNKIAQYEEGIEISGPSVSVINYILKKSDPFAENIKETGSNAMLLTSGQCRVIDFEWTRTLNRIEAVISAWDYNAANKRIMEEHFGPLVNENWKLLMKLISPPNDYFPVIRDHLNRNPRIK